MIDGFRDREAERIFHRERSKRYGSIERAVFRKLRAIHAARLLTDLLHPPGNRLEALKGGRVGQYSIRVNDPFRLCFRWTSEGPPDVEIVDYH